MVANLVNYKQFVTIFTVSIESCMASHLPVCQCQSMLVSLVGVLLIWQSIWPLAYGSIFPSGVYIACSRACSIAVIIVFTHIKN